MRSSSIWNVYHFLSNSRWTLTLAAHPHYARRVIERASTAGISDLNKVKLYEQSGVIARQRSDTSR
jgi:hypothetical protein